MCDLCSPDLPEDKKFEQLVKIVKDHLEPQRSEIAERHMFRQRKQRQGEIVSDYLKSLKHLAKHCNFRDSLEVNLRDQFVSGLQSEDMRSRLFAERNIDYKRAIELALALEAAERHAAEAASGASSSAISEGLHRIRSSPARAERGRMKRREGAGGVQADAAARAGALSLEGSRRGCWRCGRSGHPPSRCRYKFYSCDSCGQRGHLKVVCGNVDKCSDAVIQKNTKELLRKEFPEVFADGLGTFKTRMQLHLADKTPIFVKSRPLPLALRAPVERELERLQRDDVIYKVDRSDYGTPIVPIIKKNGDIRICGDFKVTINPLLKDFHYPLPQIEDIFATLGGGEQFSKLDLSHAYQQVLLTEDSQPMTAITTHIGTFVYKRVPFGIKCVPEYFEKLIEETLCGLSSTVAFQDDICVTGKDRETHCKNLRAVLARLKEAGLRVNWSKCEFFKDSVTYLGYKIDKKGLHTDANKIKAIVSAPSPKDKNVKWYWSCECESAFKRVKNIISSSPVLAHYDPKLPLLLSVDSSAYGLGAVLTHRYSDGSESLISCASRTLNEAEQQGCLVWGYRVIIPASLHSAVLDELHSGHIGVVKMKQLARNYLWWSGLDADIERVCRECTVCAALRAQPPPAPLHSWEWPVEPWSRLNVDFLGPFRNKYYLVILDAHSKWLEVEPVPNTSAATVISCLRKIFARFGLCKVTVSDNGPPFSSSEYLHYLNKNGIKRILVAPYHPSSNGAAENVVKTVKLVLKKAIIENVNLEKALCTFLFTYRNTEHCTTQKEPSVALLGHRLRGRLDLLRPNTRDVIRDKQSSQEERRGGSLREMSTGDRVLVRNYNNNLVKWKEGVVLDRTGPVSYVVKTDDDNRTSRRHVDQILDKNYKKSRYTLTGMVDNENSGEREMNDEAFKSFDNSVVGSSPVTDTENQLVKAPSPSQAIPNTNSPLRMALRPRVKKMMKL
ncbi:uncharacterized protein K02A2.6-like [Pararge aegeria]|uniref:uncharacterized protein K02A2.6-like n=1 Tax=Pararge aegeria TaxID=116150 RepID=UPI0019D29E14|nr:uncharacterized protein K02A2.6-like [Pararge aegeria]